MARHRQNMPTTNQATLRDHHHHANNLTSKDLDFVLPNIIKVAWLPELSEMLNFFYLFKNNRKKYNHFFFCHFKQQNY